TGQLALVGPPTDVFGLHAGETIASQERKLALVIPADRKPYALAVREAVRRGEPWQAQYRIRRPRDGATAWLAESATVDESSDEPAYVVMTWDITGLRHVEEQLRLGSRRLRRELTINRRLYEVLTSAAEADDIREGVETL